MGSSDLDDADQAARAERLSARRKTLMFLFGIVLIAVAAGWGAWWYFVSSHYVSTDNAYVQVSAALVTPLTSGRVMEVRVHDAEQVQKGDVLVVIDPEDAKIAVAQAEGAYAMTQRKVETYFAAEAGRQADYDRTKAEYERRQNVKETGAVSPEELAGMKAAYEGATAALSATQALTQNTTPDQHPEVLIARAQLAAAHLALSRTIIRAPVTGIVAQGSVQVGQMATAGHPVMTVVPIAQVYVDANFKEDQLNKVRPGQPVTLVSDLYGSSVEFHGHVMGIGGGTGSAFAVIPAQNATGNWIKVVQRIPVRIGLDSGELKQRPLRVGSSMQATIDISQ